MKIGHGVDVHAFADGRTLVLGGVTIPGERGLAAHSDGDVVIHALCDALLGAAGLGDIGKYFPATEEYRDIASISLLEMVMEMLGKEKHVLVNADLSIVAQTPRLSAFLPEMKHMLAATIGVEASCINIKATTTDHLGYIGRGEGIEVHAVVLLA